MMKKYLCVCILAAVCLSCMFLPAYAATGDAIGNIYATDIKAVVNGVTVPSYNIGGKTAVIIEDITDGYEYNDGLRTLLFWSLAPDDLKSGENVSAESPGSVVGDIYETDIATYIYDRKLPAYALNGKTAVAIEDLGADREFSDIGGKYIWDPDSRVIELEFMYPTDDIFNILDEKRVSLELTETTDNIAAVFESDPLQYGSIGASIAGASEWERPFREIVSDGVLIGYCFRRPTYNFYVGDGGQYQLMTDQIADFYYFYPDKVGEVLADVEPAQPTREERIEYYEEQSFTVIDSLETDEYTFLYMSQANAHGGSEYLRRIAVDGTEICYDQEFQSVSFWGNKYFENVVVDKTDEKVYLHYDKDYVIDLKTGVMSAVE